MQSNGIIEWTRMESSSKGIKWNPRIESDGFMIWTRRLSSSNGIDGGDRLVSLGLSIAGYRAAWVEGV